MLDDRHGLKVQKGKVNIHIHTCTHTGVHIYLDTGMYKYILIYIQVVL